MITHNRRLNFLSIFMISALLVALVGFVPAGTAQAACGTTYVVQSGDTIGGIAQNCGTTISAIARANPNITDLSLIYPGQTILLPGAVTVIPNTGQEVYIVKPLDNMSQIAVNFGVSLNALIAANPGIADPSLIYTGERILIPNTTPGIPNTGGAPSIQLDQTAGPAGTVIYVNGANFPANVGVNINLGQEGTSLESVLAVDTGIDGRFSVAVTIPATAIPGTTWIVQAYTEAAGGIVTNAFYNVQTSSSENVYIVRPGDTLGEIAARFGTTVSDLQKANPSIVDPNLIYSGQQIIIP